MNKKKKIIYSSIILFFAILLITAFYNGLTVKRYTIQTDKIASDSSITIVLITDLHSHFYGDNQIKLINLIKKQSPDMIALSGDIYDDNEPFRGAEVFLTEVEKIAPVFYVTGNHEIWSGEIIKIKADITALGIDILDNERQMININGNDICISGIDDPYIIDYDPEIHKSIINRLQDTMGSDENSPYYNEVDIRNAAWSDILESIWDDDNSSHYSILLSHRPELVDYYDEYDYDLILSGHAHGGQVRIPFLLNGLFAPDQGFFPKYAGGLYQYNNTNHIVSRGLSYNPKLPRIFNPPEVVVIDIVGKKQNE